MEYRVGVLRPELERLWVAGPANFSNRCAAARGMMPTIAVSPVSHPYAASRRVRPRQIDCVAASHFSDHQFLGVTHSPMILESLCSAGPDVPIVYDLPAPD